MNKVISKDGTHIAYRKLGEGPPVVLVDGALCSSLLGPMPELAALLAKQFAVIYYDRRGRNESGDTQPYHVDREVEDMEALLRIADGPAFVFGTSSGAALALAAASKGLDMKKLAVYEPPFMIDKNEHRPPVEYHTKLTQLATTGKRSDAIKYFMTAGIGIPAPFVFLMQLMPAWSKMKAVAHTLPYDAAIMGDFLIPTHIGSSIKVSTLVAGGEKSQSWLHTAVKELSGMLPNNEFVMLKGQNHNVSVKVLAPVLSAFFLK